MHQCEHHTPDPLLQHVSLCCSITVGLARCTTKSRVTMKKELQSSLHAAISAT
jgi:hypothetical protein